jgi:hypothetical protein
MPHARVGAVRVLLCKRLCRLYLADDQVQRFALFTLLVIVPFASHGQTTHYGSLWVRYFNQTKLTDRLTLNAHIDERILFNPVRQFQLFTHVHFNFLVKPWLDVGVGGNFNWTNAATYSNLMVPEWRPWQEATLIKPLSHAWQFQFRYRIDERFMREIQNGELGSTSHFNWRHRFRPQFLYTYRNADNNNRYVFRISNEYMVNTGDVRHTFDQNRFYFSFEHPLGERWSLETGYMNQSQSRPNDDGLNNRHLIRLSFYHRVDARRKEQSTVK